MNDELKKRRFKLPRLYFIISSLLKLNQKKFGLKVMVNSALLRKLSEK
jgi:hypothetical protein